MTRLHQILGARARSAAARAAALRDAGARRSAALRTRLPIGLPRPTIRWVGFAVIAALLVALAYLVTLAEADDRRSAAIAAEEAARYRPPALPDPAPVLAVVGDDLSVAPAGRSMDRWTASVARTLTLDVAVDAADGRSYIPNGVAADGTQSFAACAANVPSTASVVVLFGGENDVGTTPLRLVMNATKALAAASTAAPRAQLVVVGPVSPTSRPSTALLHVRNSLHHAAAIDSARFIDPIADRWFSGHPGLMDRSGHPTSSGREIIARHLAEALRPLFAR